MPTRSGDGFSFPIRKFDDGQGLYTNFKYLEQWLRRLGQSGGVVGYALVGFDVDGENSWTPGTIEWGSGTKVVEDDFGLISGYSGTDDIYIHVTTAGLYYVEFNISINRGTDASAFSWQCWQASVMQTTSGGAGIALAVDTQITVTDADTNANDVQASLGTVFRITDTTDRIFASFSTLRSAANAGTEFNAIFLEGYDSTPSTTAGTYIKLVQLGA